MQVLAAVRGHALLWPTVTRDWRSLKSIWRLLSSLSVKRVTVEVDTFPGRLFQGHVDSLSPASGQEFALLPPDNATGNFTKVVQRIPVKIVLDQTGALPVVLRPGMSVYPTIDTRSAATEIAA